MNAANSSGLIASVRAIIASTRFGSRPFAAAYFSAIGSRPLTPADAVAPDVSGPPAKVLKPPPPLTFLSEREFCDTYPSVSPTFTFTHAPSRLMTWSCCPFFTVATTFPATLGAPRTSSSGRFTHTSSATTHVAVPAIVSPNASRAAGPPALAAVRAFHPPRFRHPPRRRPGNRQRECRARESSSHWYLHVLASSFHEMSDILTQQT